MPADPYARADALEKLRDGLMGTEDFPGGLIGQIRTDLALVSVRLKSLEESLPGMTVAAIRKERDETRSKQMADLVAGTLRTVLGVAVIVAGAVILHHYGVSP